MCRVFAVVIPLVNPQLELLPVHFATDPGPDYDWQLADACRDVDLPADGKVGLLERYMDVQVSSVPPAPPAENVKRAEAFDRLMHKRGSSLDSAQVNSLVHGTTLEPDDARKQGSSSGFIHGAVVRTFGSLGQSVSQKLKSFALRTGKQSVGTATQSSRRNTVAVRMLSNHRQVSYNC